MEDEKIIDYTYENDLIIITFDKDFGELVFRYKQKTKGIILLRIVIQSHRELSRVLIDLISNTTIIRPNYFIVVKSKHIRSIKIKN